MPAGYYKRDNPSYYKPCSNCHKQFKVFTCWIKKGAGLYCSIKCRYDFTRIKRISITCKQCQKSFEVKPRKDKIVLYCSKSCATKSHKRQLKENVKYSGLHLWVRRHKGIAKVCYFCGNGGRCEWANISHQYKRDLNDFINLCVSCHKYFDTHT